MAGDGQEYSDPLRQCLRLSLYKSQSDSNNPQPPSNKIAIIVGAVIGGVFVIVVIACICCRDRIKALIVPNQEINPSNPNMQSQNHVSLPQVNTIANINFIFESSSTQMHYEK